MGSEDVYRYVIYLGPAALIFLLAAYLIYLKKTGHVALFAYSFAFAYFVLAGFSLVYNPIYPANIDTGVFANGSTSIFDFFFSREVFFFYNLVVPALELSIVAYPIVLIAKYLLGRIKREGVRLH